MRALLSILFLLFAILPSSVAQADELRPAYLEMTEVKSGVWKILVKLPSRTGLSAATSPSLPGFCTKTMDSQRIVSGALLISWHAKCAQSLVGEEVGLVGLELGQTDALVRIQANGRAVQTAHLTVKEPTTKLPKKPERWNVARTYLITGVEHILFGYDHLLFVVALVLLLGSGWVIAKAVTAFTVAHSITLIGSTLGFLGIPQRPVEVVIALSILFLAVEIVKADPKIPRLSQRIPWMVAFLFGLLHGFGFAGALAEIGLPQGEVPVALLTFNVGVEVGQLLIVGVTMALLAMLGRFLPIWLRPAIYTAAYGIGIISASWFIERTLD